MESHHREQSLVPLGSALGTVYFRCNKLEVFLSLHKSGMVQMRGCSLGTKEQGLPRQWQAELTLKPSLKGPVLC